MNALHGHCEHTDFGILHADLTVRTPTRKAPNPLRNADPKRLREYHEALASIAAARWAALRG
jgi:hypothetical protein